MDNVSILKDMLDTQFKVPEFLKTECEIHYISQSELDTITNYFAHSPLPQLPNTNKTVDIDDFFL